MKVQLIAYLLLSVMGTSCAGGIRQNTKEPQTEAAGGGAPVAPLTPVITAGGAGAGVVATRNVTLFIRTGATAFRQTSAPSGTEISDPAFKAGIQQALKAVDNEK